MNKTIQFLLVTIFLNSCSNISNKNNFQDNSINYNQLNQFVRDSLPQFVLIDEKYLDIVDLWDAKPVIESTLQIISKDSKTLPFFFESLRLEIEKIQIEQIPYDLKVPQIVGRFRVYKTQILKISETQKNNLNLNLYKQNLLDLVKSYNALVNMVNIISKDIDQKK